MARNVQWLWGSKGHVSFYPGSLLCSYFMAKDRQALRGGASPPYLAGIFFFRSWEPALQITTPQKLVSPNPYLALTSGRAARWISPAGSSILTWRVLTCKMGIFSLSRVDGRDEIGCVIGFLSRYLEHLKKGNWDSLTCPFIQQTSVAVYVWPVLWLSCLP